MFQTGLHGEYAVIHHSCDNDNRLLYRQTHVAEGWSNRFYLYYLKDEGGDHLGYWQFGEQALKRAFTWYELQRTHCRYIAGMFECSDHAFARARDDASEGHRVTSQWEELINGAFHSSHNFRVECKGEEW